VSHWNEPISEIFGFFPAVIKRLFTRGLATMAQRGEVRAVQHAAIAKHTLDRPP